MWIQGTFCLLFSSSNNRDWSSFWFKTQSFWWYSWYYEDCPDFLFIHLFWFIFIFREMTRRLNKITPEPLPCANWGDVKPLSLSLLWDFLTLLDNINGAFIVLLYSSVRLFVLIAFHQKIIYHKEFIIVQICGPNGSMFGSIERDRG